MAVAAYPPGAHYTADLLSRDLLEVSKKQPSWHERSVIAGYLGSRLPLKLELVGYNGEHHAIESSLRSQFVGVWFSLMYRRAMLNGQNLEW
jgi:hypothetical protein